MDWLLGRDSMVDIDAAVALRQYHNETHWRRAIHIRHAASIRNCR